LHFGRRTTDIDFAPKSGRNTTSRDVRYLPISDNQHMANCVDAPVAPPEYLVQ